MVVKNGTKEQLIPFVLAIVNDVNLSNRLIKVVWEEDD
jgi:ribosomal 30S subunit maturation factor RimM